MIELPYSFSQVNSNNNILNYSYVDNNGGGHSYTSNVSIPIGNYNINHLLTQLVSSLLIDIYIKIPTSTLTTTSFLISYTPQTGLCTYYINPAVGYTITITLNFSLNYVLGIMFGFNEANKVFGTAVKLTSNQKIMVNPITSVYLRSETLKFESNYEAVISKMNNSDIICKIPVTTLPNSIIYYRSEYASIVSNNNFSSLNLYLSDNLSTTYELDMQGVNYGVYIRIDEVMMPSINSYKDKIGSSIPKAPEDFLKERDELLHDLLQQKLKLENELKKSNNKDVSS